MDRLPDILRQSDFLIINLPGSKEMRDLIGEQQLRSMKPTSYFINLVTREIVGDEALAKALHNGWIGGAACNVFGTNPLPAESPLWDAPNLIISPNVAQTDPKRWQKLRKVFTDNLASYLPGRPMTNVVNAEGSY
jgi:phosphoglycerate dehydrogenase-like enzyme